MKSAEEICKPFGEDVRLEWDEVADFIRAAQADAIEAAALLGDKAAQGRRDEARSYRDGEDWDAAGEADEAAETVEFLTKDIRKLKPGQP